MQRELLPPDNYGVTGIVATVELYGDVDILRELICGFAFTFVAPLGTQNYYRRHVESFCLVSITA